MFCIQKVFSFSDWFSCEPNLKLKVQEVNYTDTFIAVQKFLEIWELTALGTPTSDSTPVASSYPLSDWVWQADRLYVRVEVYATFTAGSHLYDGYVVTVWSICQSFKACSI